MKFWHLWIAHQFLFFFVFVSHFNFTFVGHLTRIQWENCRINLTYNQSNINSTLGVKMCAISPLSQLWPYLSFVLSNALALSDCIPIMTPPRPPYIMLYCTLHRCSIYFYMTCLTLYLKTNAGKYLAPECWLSLSPSVHIHFFKYIVFHFITFI